MSQADRVLFDQLVSEQHSQASGIARESSSAGEASVPFS